MGELHLVFFPNRKRETAPVFNSCWQQSPSAPTKLFDAMTPTVLGGGFAAGQMGRIPQSCKEISLFSTNRQRKKTDENEKLTFR